MGQATDILIHAEEISKTKKQLNKIYAKHTGKPLEIIGEFYSKEKLATVLFFIKYLNWNSFKIEQNMERDKFMSPQEALEFGLIDKILTHPNDELEKKE